MGGTDTPSVFGPTPPPSPNAAFVPAGCTYTGPELDRHRLRHIRLRHVQWLAVSGRQHPTTLFCPTHASPSTERTFGGRSAWRASRVTPQRLRPSHRAVCCVCVLPPSREFHHRIKGISLSRWSADEVEKVAGNKYAARAWLATWEARKFPKAGVAPRLRDGTWHRVPSTGCAVTRSEWTEPARNARQPVGVPNAPWR